MGKATRTLAMAGMALIAGATIGAGPAMAAAPAAQGSTTTAGTATQQAQVQPRRDRIVGYYRSERSCEWAGRVGERRGHWDDYDCSYVRRGPRHGWWALEAQWRSHGNNNHGNNNNHNNHNNNNNNNHHPHRP